jgi:hypothetical protein
MARGGIGARRRRPAGVEIFVCVRIRSGAMGSRSPVYAGSVVDSAGPHKPEVVKAHFHNAEVVERAGTHKSKPICGWTKRFLLTSYTAPRK